VAGRRGKCKWCTRILLQNCKFCKMKRGAHPEEGPRRTQTKPGARARVLCLACTCAPALHGETSPLRAKSQTAHRAPRHSLSVRETITQHVLFCVRRRAQQPPAPLLRCACRRRVRRAFTCPPGCAARGAPLRHL
jgi:hypothetical protein